VTVPPPQTDRRALAFVLVTVLIDTIGFGIIIPVIPSLIMELTGESLSDSSIYGGWLLFLYAFMLFVCAPILGNLSDRVGRRPVLLASLGAYAFDYLMMAFAPTIAWLFVGRAVAGITGATGSAANAYIADVSAPEDRAANFGLIGAAWGLGFILGPVIGGVLGGYGTRVPFLAAAGLAAANLVYGFFAIPESLAPEHRRAFSFTRANPVGALRSMKHFPVVFGLFVSLVFYQLAHDANPSVWSYFTMLKFGWSEREVGLSLGVFGVLNTLVQAVLIRRVIPVLGERRTAALGLSMTSAGFLGFALAPSAGLFLLCMVPFALGGLAMPALRGIMSNAVPEDRQGELQGAITSVTSLTMIFAPLLMTRLFHAFTGEAAPFYFPGAAHFAAALLALASLSSAVVASRRSRLASPLTG